MGAIDPQHVDLLDAGLRHGVGRVSDDGDDGIADSSLGDISQELIVGPDIASAHTRG